MRGRRGLVTGITHPLHAISSGWRWWLIVAGVVLASGSRVPASQAAAPQSSLSFAFTNVAPESGLTDVTVFGGTATNKYLLETTGTGVAVIDYDDDGWLDVFVVNGSDQGPGGVSERRRAHEPSVSQQQMARSKT